MAARAIRTDESLALVLAVAAHAVLFAWLALQRPAPPPPLPERMTVTLSDELGPVSTSPEPMADPAPDVGPVLGETPAEPEPVVTPEPKPSPKALAKAPARVPPKAPPKTQPKQPPKQPPKKGGVSSFDEVFGPGTPGGQGKSETKNPPATAFGAKEQAALRAAIMRQLKPHWVSPQGIDADKLVTVVRFRLNRDGNVIGEPILVSQVTNPANAAQARRHFEQAKKAITLAQPFLLPPDLFTHWQTVNSTFDKGLSR